MEKYKTDLKGIICGFFKTSEYKPVKIGTILPYLGKVREERYLVKINELKWKENSWQEFLQEVELL